MHDQAVVEIGELDEAVDLLNRTYARMQVAVSGDRHRLRLAQNQLGNARLDDLHYEMAYEAMVEPLGSLLFGTMTAGRLAVTSDGETRQLEPGDSFLTVQPEHACSVAVDDYAAHVVVLDPADLAAHLGPLSTGSPEPVRFTGYTPVSAAHARLWQATSAYVRHVVRSDLSIAEQPLIATNAEHMLIAAALATFPNTAVPAAAPRDRRDASSTTLRRAVAFVDEHAHEPIRIGDIARASGVTGRAVQLAFRRHLQLTPLEYLRQVRVERAHLDLLAADPDTVSVADVALRWGFASPSRFAMYYRHAYGQTPDSTLRG